MILDYAMLQTTDVKVSVMHIATEKFVDVTNKDNAELSNLPTYKPVDPFLFPGLYKLAIDANQAIPNGYYLVCYHDPVTEEVLNMSVAYLVSGNSDILQTPKQLKFALKGV